MSTIEILINDLSDDIERDYHQLALLEALFNRADELEDFTITGEQASEVRKIVGRAVKTMRSIACELG